MIIQTAPLNGSILRICLKLKSLSKESPSGTVWIVENYHNSLLVRKKKALTYIIATKDVIVLLLCKICITCCGLIKYLL